MPLWKICTPVNAFTAKEKADLAIKITDIYTSEWTKGNFGYALPKFYVSVLFQEYKAEDFYVGGDARKNFVQIEAVHIARTNEGTAALAGCTVEEILRRYFENINGFLMPYITSRGYEVEFHVETAPFETWQIDGMTPPPPNSAEEARWYKENRSSPYVPGDPAEDIRLVAIR